MVGSPAFRLTEEIGTLASHRFCDHGLWPILLAPPVSGPLTGAERSFPFGLLLGLHREYANRCHDRPF
jgi:hypothetical protein